MVLPLTFGTANSSNPHPSTQPLTHFVGHNILTDPKSCLNLVKLSSHLPNLIQASDDISRIHHRSIANDLGPLWDLELIDPSPPGVPVTAKALKTFIQANTGLSKSQSGLNPRKSKTDIGPLQKHILNDDFISAIRLHHEAALSFVETLNRTGSLRDFGINQASDTQATFSTATKVFPKFLEWADKKASLIDWANEKDVVSVAVMLRMLGGVVGDCLRASTSFSCWISLLKDYAFTAKSRMLQLGRLSLPYKAYFHPFASGDGVPDKRTFLGIIAGAKKGSKRCEGIVKLYSMGLEKHVIQDWETKSPGFVEDFQVMLTDVPILATYIKELVLERFNRNEESDSEQSPRGEGSSTRRSSDSEKTLVDYSLESSGTTRSTTVVSPSRSHINTGMDGQLCCSRGFQHPGYGRQISRVPEIISASIEIGCFDEDTDEDEDAVSLPSTGSSSSR